MTEYLYHVGLRDKRTGEKINLRVWGKNTDDATHKLAGILYGWQEEYTWTGSGPINENNKLIERESE